MIQMVPGKVLKVKNESFPAEEAPSAGAGSESQQTINREWTWNQDQYGYEGVHLHEGEVLWFEHRHNTLEGGAARSQSFEDFLEHGPTCPLPAEFLAELHAAVKRLVSQKAR